MKAVIKKFGRDFNTCRICTTHKSIIRKYKMNLCRKCLKDHAYNLGWSV